MLKVSIIDTNVAISSNPYNVVLIGITSECFHEHSTMELKETTKGGDSDKSEVIEKPIKVACADEDPKTAM